MRLTERTNLGGKLRIEDNIVHVDDVSVLSSVSRNLNKEGKPRQYSDQALNQAVTLFEGAKVYLNHIDPSNTGIHDVRDFVGRLTGITREGNVVKAKTLKVVNSAHEQLIKDIVIRDAAAVGLSIDAEGIVDDKGNVDSLVNAYSVDIVSDPATTRSLFESKENKVDLSGLTLEELKKLRPDLLTEITKPLEERIKALEEAAAMDDEEDDEEEEEDKKMTESREVVVLRKIAESGVKMSKTSIKAALTLDDKELDEFIQEQVSRGPRLRESKKRNIDIESLLS